MPAGLESYRYAWEMYANEVFFRIHKMSDEERTQSIELLRYKCAAFGVPWEQAKYIVEYPGGMTEKELELRSALQSRFSLLSPDVLQSHFTHFYQNGPTIKHLGVEAAAKANKVIIDELGKALLGKGFQPQRPSQIPPTS